MRSMTGYAALDAPGRRWELRGVNGRGLDLRLRLPDRPAGLEAAARAAVGAVAARGSLTLTLRLEPVAGQGAPRVDADALGAVLDGLAEVLRAAEARGLDLAPARASDLLAMRGVWDAGAVEGGPDLAALTADLATLCAEFDAARRVEGAALRGALAGQVDEIDALADRIVAVLPDRAEAQADALRAAFARLRAAAPEAEASEARVASEVAALAVRADVAEEVDRLRAHVAAARELLASEGPVGRRFDFLAQELNREANTLCAKSGHAGLTALGLELKTVIDRLREQVQNVE